MKLTIQFNVEVPDELIPSDTPQDVLGDLADVLTDALSEAMAATVWDVKVVKAADDTQVSV